MSTLNKAHLRKVTEKTQMCDGALHPSPFGIFDLLNTQKCLKDFFVRRGMFGDYAGASEIDENGTPSLKSKEKDDKINRIIKSIVEKSIADIAKMRQLIALWDAEERSASHSYIDESSYGLVTQQKIKQYLRDFFSERLTSAENPRELQDAEAADEDGGGGGLSRASPIIGRAMNMISHVIQPVVDTLDSASKAVIRMLARNDQDDQEPAAADASDPGARRLHPGLSPRESTRGLSSAPDDAPSASSSPPGKVRSGRKEDSRAGPAKFDQAVMEELCNLQFDVQLTPRLSPILEETAETNSSASSSAVLDRMGESASSLLVASEAAALAGSSVPTPATSASTREKTGEAGARAMKTRTAAMELPLRGRKPDDETSSPDSSEGEAAKVGCAMEAWSTARLFGVSPVPSPARSSPMIEKAKNIICHVMHPVVTASRVTRTAGRSIAKKVKSMWKYRSGRKKGKRGKGKNERNAEGAAPQRILDKEDGEEEGVRGEDRMEVEEDAEGEQEEEEEEEASAAEVDSASELSAALGDSARVGSPEAPSCIEGTAVQKPAGVSADAAVEEFCFYEAESPSVISTPFLDPGMAGSCDPTSSSSAAPVQAKSGNSTPDVLKAKRPSRAASVRETEPQVAETDEVRDSEIDPLQSEEDGSEQNIYSIFENIFREEFSKKLENSLRQGLRDAVRVYVPERGSTESLESAVVSCELADKDKREIDVASLGSSGSTSITSFSSYQLLEERITRRCLSEGGLKATPPEGLDPKRKSLWKRWKMRRARKILPGLLECHCTPGAGDSTSSEGKAEEPAIKSILKKVTSMWK